MDHNTNNCATIEVGPSNLYVLLGSVPTAPSQDRSASVALSDGRRRRASAPCPPVGIIVALASQRLPIVLHAVQAMDSKILVDGTPITCAPRRCRRRGVPQSRTSGQNSPWWLRNPSGDEAAALGTDQQLPPGSASARSPQLLLAGQPQTGKVSISRVSGSPSVFFCMLPGSRHTRNINSPFWSSGSCGAPGAIMPRRAQMGARKRHGCVVQERVAARRHFASRDAC